MKQTGYFLLRLSVGINFFFHAVNRFYYGFSGFREWVVSEFSITFIPASIVNIYAFILPIFEAIIGILLIVGFKTKWGLIMGSLVISSLILGSCLIHKWDWVGLQMVYALCFYILFEKFEQNTKSLDDFLAKKI